MHRIVVLCRAVCAGFHCVHDLVCLQKYCPACKEILENCQKIFDALNASHICSACAAVVATEGMVATVGAMGAMDADGDAASLDANLIAQRAASSGPLQLSNEVPASSCN